MGHRSAPTQAPHDYGVIFGWVGVGFFIGFAVATAVGILIVLPMQRSVWQTQMDSDVNHGVQAAIEGIEQSAAREECEATAARLRSFLGKFEAYRRREGPPPEQWATEFSSTTRRVE
jgi:hypothetical protein